MNASEQISKAVALLDWLAHTPEPLRPLGWASPAEKGLMAKCAGCSLPQFDQWLAGRWTPPVDQNLLLLEQARDYVQRRLWGAPAAAMNGAVSHG